MSDLVKRLRDRPNDAPMTSERLMDESADRIEHLERVLMQAREALKIIAAQHSGEVCGTSRSDGMAAIALAALSLLDKEKPSIEG
jgi:hypothetical protein